jgi:hypothetical protein
MDCHISSNEHNTPRQKTAVEIETQAKPIQLSVPVSIDSQEALGLSQDDLPMEAFEPEVLPVCQPLLERLQGLATVPWSSSQLAFVLDAIAKEFERPVSQIEKLYAPLRHKVQEAGDETSLLESLEAGSSAAEVDVLELVPPALAAGFEAMRASIEYEPELMLAVLLTGLSGALPLESRIELNAQMQYQEPLVLWFLLLMPSGELKSPLTKRLVSAPWQQTVEPLMERRYEEELVDWAERKALAKTNQEAFSEKEPVMPLTLVSGELSSPGMDESFAAHDRWAKRSMLLEVDEAARILKQLQEGDKLANWMLSRYDGKGSVNALVEAGRQRRYKQCRLAALMACQPDLYYAIAGDGDVSGMNARLLVVEQHLVRLHHKDSYTAEEIQAGEELTKLLEKLYGAAAACESLKLKLSERAFGRFQQERRALDARKRDCLLDADRSLLSKSAGRIGRLAGMFHLLWQIVEPPDGVELEEDQEVGEEAMERAIAFHALLLEKTMQVRRKAHEHGTPPELGLRLHDKTWARAGHSASLSELRRVLDSTNRPCTDEVIAALKPLTTKGYGKLHKNSRRGQPGPPGSGKMSPPFIRTSGGLRT